MCGVFGYVGAEIDLGVSLMNGLRTLEYRGYDSWGIAYVQNGVISVTKETGGISGAVSKPAMSGAGFGHTRWATHGGVTNENAHPHLDDSGRVAVVHNGIIENHRELKAELASRGITFRSETDSEVVAHLLAEELAGGSTLTAGLATVFARLDGLNAIVALDARTHELVATKRVSPLVAGVVNRGSFIASDALALRGHLDAVVYLEDHHLLSMSEGGLKLFDRTTLEPIVPDFVALDGNVESASLGEFPYFMAKEIAEQPATIDRLIDEARPQIEQLAGAIAAAGNVILTGCGTAIHAAQTGQYYFASIARMPVQPVAASEFPLVRPFLNEDSLVIALSQSGETVDVIQAMMTARDHGGELGALVNVANSTLDRMVHQRVHLNTGPEQCVLATKSYMAKVTVLLLTAYAIVGEYDRGAEIVRQAARGLSAMLEPARNAHVARVAQTIQHAANLFVIGRGLSYPSALEAALKIKEVSYIHAEGFAAGELKHGVIALVEEGTPCLVLAPNDETLPDVLSGAMELKSRGGFMIGVGPLDNDAFDLHIPTPDLPLAAPLLQALPAQLLGYHLALLRGHDPDRPRNLAKSVTVK